MANILKGLDTHYRPLLLGLLSTAMLVSIAGCTSGGGDNVTFTNDGQGADPVVLEIPVAYIRRPIPEESVDIRDPLEFRPGAELILRERSSVSAADINVTEQIAAIVAEEEGIAVDQLAIDIKGVEASFAGDMLVFAARVVPEPVDANLEDTTWNLWILDLETLQVEYLIPSRIKRNEGVETGGGHDIDPHFLTDDRIVFSSTRQVASQARQLNEGRIQIFAALDEDNDDPASVLHIYDPQQRDAEFEQISFNLSHDLDPVVLSTGEIVFSRWNNTSTNHISLYRINPQGGSLSPLYGYHSQNTGTDGAAVEYMQPRELDDGRLIAITKSFSAESFGGEVVIIDSAGYVEADQPIWENQGSGGSGQEPLTDTEVRTDGLLSLGGQFGSVYPLRDGTARLLITWSDCLTDDEDGITRPCTLLPDNTEPATPAYGAWVYDTIADTQRPVVLPTEGMMVTEIIAAEPRDFPDLAPTPDTFNADLALADQGKLLIDSVYDLDGVDDSPAGIALHAEPGTPPYTNRRARFLRVVQPVPIPDDDVFDIPRYAFGVSTASSFREIAGYVPIEPDGSVTVNLAANRPFTFSVLDVNGRRIGARHNYWLQVGAGEVLQCAGCHTRNSTLPHGRLDSQPPTSNPGARALANGATGFPGTDSSDLFATEIGATMAETWEFHRPIGNATAPSRDLSLSQSYVDEWSGPAVTPDPDILDRDYDPAWTDIPADKPIIVANLDPRLPSRIVINYIDHIHPIWERVRTPIDDGTGVLVDTCIGCHNTTGDTLVPPGQLDLTSTASDIDPDHYRSYRELLSTDNEQWLTIAGNLADRQRICTDVDDEGNILTFTETFTIGATMRAGSANGSGGFFDCFEGGSCGPNGQSALPANCTEDGGTVVPATQNTVDHSGLLSPSELRLLSEWLDIGAQYYNNPFDPRLSD